jgi:hypothetical protein
VQLRQLALEHCCVRTVTRASQPFAYCDPKAETVAAMERMFSAVATGEHRRRDRSGRTLGSIARSSRLGLGRWNAYLTTKIRSIRGWNPSVPVAVAVRLLL